ncbi:MAG: methionine gamma-lyase family protein [Clostridia bacterium]|nr:methionine gamma-lyase family protein [Clostridia bacterium]
MDKREFLKNEFGVTEDVLDLIASAEDSVSEQFLHIDQIAQLGALKVMKAFADNRVSSECFAASSGYGTDDYGRDTLDKVYAEVFEAEDALVRHNFISGTHTLSTMLFAVLRPNDTFAAITGKPYDTLEEVIGIRGESGGGSLADFGIKYIQIDLLPSGEPDYDKIKTVLTENSLKAVWIQRSKGYADRKTFSSEKIGEMTAFVKKISPKTLVLVDNCYGEFVDDREPTAYGADLMGGSLIKNAGASIAPTGGYIAGKSELIKLCANRLSSVGIGRENGATLGLNKPLYQGFFFAPHVVSQALKTATLCAAVFEKLGYIAEPSSKEVRHDIVQAIKLKTGETLEAFCRGIQKGSPIDAYVTPVPSYMPGYSDDVIMAAGAFNQGSSIELSADGPMRPPYSVYMQGGVTYESAKLGIIMAVQEMKNKGII